jgi:hypothetical protein
LSVIDLAGGTDVLLLVGIWGRLLAMRLLLEGRARDGLHAGR